MSKDNSSSGKPTNQRVDNVVISEKRSKDVPAAKYDRPKPPGKPSDK